MGSTGRERDDATLLRCIAMQRDEVAFSELYERYAASAASLAFHVVGDAPLADEAVQNAMVKVWTAAATFRELSETEPVNNGRAWIMKIIARECYQLLRKRRRSREVASETLNEAPAETTERVPEESLVALRKSMNTLPESERQLLALHFGGGLSQEEVGEALEMSQQTVSYRLNKALKSLKTQLAAAGVGSAAFVTSANMQQALLTGPGPGMNVPAAAVLEKIYNLPAAGKSASIRRASMRTAKSSSSGAYIAAGIVVVLLCGAALLAGSKKAPTQPAASAPAPAKPATAPPPSYRWTFENGPTPDLVVAAGQWKWQKDAKVMQADVDTWIAIESARLTGVPYLYRVRGQMAPGAYNMAHGLALVGPEGDLSIREHWRLLDTHFDKPVTEFRCYIVGATLIEYFGDKLTRVVLHERTHENTGLLVRIEHLVIASMELTSISEADIPAEAREWEKLKTAMVRVDKMTVQEQNDLAKRQREAAQKRQTIAP